MADVSNESNAYLSDPFDAARNVRKSPTDPNFPEGTRKHLWKALRGVRSGELASRLALHWGSH